MPLSSTTTITRGTTVSFTTTFYDVNGNVVQPAAATINITYPTTAGGSATFPLAMTGPTGNGTWTAQWDSRGAGIGAVEWSVHSDPGPPFGVEDGYFVLTGNLANQVVFS